MKAWLYNDNNNDPKKQILDPIGTMCVLIEILFRPLGTKFGINNHSVNIDLPTEHWMDVRNIQSYNRYINNDSRENISKIGVAIIRLLEWYIIPTKKQYNQIKRANKTEKIIYKEEEKMGEEGDIVELWECLDNLTEYLILALERLVITYGEGNVIWALQCYINLIKEGKKDNYNRNNIPKVFVGIITDEKEKNDGKDISDNIILDNNIINYGKIKSLWSLKSIKEIHDLYYKAYKTLNTIKTEKREERETREMVVSRESNLSKIEKDRLIEGYLSAIKIFIDIGKKNFIELIAISTSY
jgi:hypothetical protein